MESKSPERIRVTVWNEYRHEKENPGVSAIYPDGIHGTIASFLRADGEIETRTATLDEPEHGLTAETLAETDVLIWWGHRAHDEVRDEVVARTMRRVHDGMGLIALHSAHFSKLFTALMGTRCTLTWRVANDRERLWNLAPAHPITRGIGRFIEIEAEEMYGEPFGIPHPEELLFISWFTGGEVFRSGATWTRGNGRIFYFRPGHETYPTYHHPEVRTVIRNAVRWARPSAIVPQVAENVQPVEPLPNPRD